MTFFFSIDFLARPFLRSFLLHSYKYKWKLDLNHWAQPSPPNSTTGFSYKKKIAGIPSLIRLVYYKQKVQLSKR